MGRRGENIRQRADGRWEARVVQGSPVNGRTNYKFLYGKTYQEAKRLKREYDLTRERNDVLANETKKEAEPSTPAAGNGAREAFSENAQILFREAAEGWLAAKKATVKESTFAYYTIMVNNQILPDLGEVPLQEVTTQRLSAFLLKRKTDGRVRNGQPLKDKTVADIKVIVRQILSWASQNDMLERMPVCPAISVRQKPTGVLTMQEQQLLEEQLLKEDTSFCLGVWLSLYGGLRIGEVCALQWKDIDFAIGTVQILKTVNRIADVSGGAPAGTRLMISSPKTDCSLRTIPLPEAVLAYLEARQKPGAWYVMTGTEHFMEPRAGLDRFKRLLKRAGVREYTWHALRHTFATRCIESGVDVKSLSEIMGHSDVEITMQRYVHPSLDTKKTQVNKLSCSNMKQKAAAKQAEPGAPV